MHSPATLLSSRLRQRLFRERASDRLPLTIHHQRIYILPTRQGWMFLLALLLMLIASVNYALSLGYALCFLLTGLFSATLLSTYRNLAGLHIQRIQATDVECGQAAEFSIELINTAHPARQDLRFAASHAATLVSIATGADADATLQVPTRRRGRLRLGRITVSSDYPLGLWRAWCYVHSPVCVVVLPAPEHPVPPAPASTDISSDSSHRTGEQGDVASLRDYRPGDALSSIAWKAVARGQGLMVRQFDTPADRGGDLDLTLETTGLSDREAQVARLAAWIKQANDTGMRIRLSLPGEVTMPGIADNAPSDEVTDPLRRLALFDDRDNAL